jgi:hypothetical protein
MVFNVRLAQPRSTAGKLWNRAQDMSPLIPFTFIVLKLTGVIAWSWWWVLSPVWISGILVVVGWRVAKTWSARRTPGIQQETVTSDG